MESLIVMAVALVALVIAWKVLAGIVKTVALVAILIVAALVVLGGGLG